MENNAISRFLSERIDAGDFPSATYLVAEKGEVVFHYALGNAVIEPVRIPATLDTIYDLASLTKVLITGLLAAKLVESGSIMLFDKLSTHLPEFDTEEKRSITIENLLTHTSGLTNWKPFYLLTNESAEIIDIIAADPLANPANSTVVYSDLNFIVLGALIERAVGRGLRNVVETDIIRPLGLTRTFYGGHDETKRETAATELGNGHERQTCIEMGYDVSEYEFRDGQIWGDVHDGNAFFMGGAAGHAGLFSTAEDVFKIALQFLPSFTQLLDPKTCELFRTNFTVGMNEDRSFAFQLSSTRDSTAGSLMGPESFGHLGFTGTSLWVEPTHERIFILLTNRTHHHSLPFVNINSVRRRYHDLVIEQLVEKHSN